MTGSFSIPPDAVRVWRGFRAPTMALDDFLSRLGAVFVPATVEMQIEAGLDGYIPTVPAGLPGKPDTTPDETAILFWDSQQTYTDGFKRLAVRTYTLTHNAVYAAGSGAQFPVLFAGELAQDQPYYLLDQPADWMHGDVRHWLAGRSPSVTPDEFRSTYAEMFSGWRTSGHLEGAIACAGDDYFVVWALGGAAPDAIEGLSAAAAARGEAWSHTFTPQPATLEAGLWDEWPGMTIAAGDSFNMQFTRRWEA